MSASIIQAIVTLLVAISIPALVAYVLGRMHGRTEDSRTARKEGFEAGCKWGLAIAKAWPDAVHADIPLTPQCAARVSGEAYQVIGALAGDTGQFEHPQVQRALDYFGSIAAGGAYPGVTDILPWALDSETRKANPEA